MIIYEKDNCWIDESYLISMHTPEGTRYSIGMLRRFIKAIEDKTEALVIIPREDILNLFNKHYNIECINKEHNLYRAKHKEY